MAGRLRRRRAVLACVAVATGLCACTAAPTVPAPTVLLPDPSPSAVASALPGVDCATSVRSGPLPEWARAGFSGDGSSFPHVEGLRGAVVGVLFGYPLSSPPRPTRENKILWVAHDPAAGPLHIDAQLEGSGPVVRREVGFGGGQSIVDLPEPGCWRLVLRWGDAATDVVDLPYSAMR